MALGANLDVDPKIDSLRAIPYLPPKFIELIIKRYRPRGRDLEMATRMGESFQVYGRYLTPLIQHYVDGAAHIPEGVMTKLRDFGYQFRIGNAPLRDVVGSETQPWVRESYMGIADYSAKTASAGAPPIIYEPRDEEYYRVNPKLPTWLPNTFVHEVGHAIDHIGGRLSNLQVVDEAFDRLPRSCTAYGLGYSPNTLRREFFAESIDALVATQGKPKEFDAYFDRAWRGDLINLLEQLATR